MEDKKIVLAMTNQMLDEKGVEKTEERTDALSLLYDFHSNLANLAEGIVNKSPFLQKVLGKYAVCIVYEIISDEYRKESDGVPESEEVRLERILERVKVKLSEKVLERMKPEDQVDL